MTQRVLVTAGAGGIGLAIAKASAAAGRVHIADVDAQAVHEIAKRHAPITGFLAGPHARTISG